MRSTICTLSMACLLLVIASAHGADEPKKGEKPTPDTGSVEVHFTDGSQLKLTLKEDTIEIVTSAGKKTVRLADLRKVQLAQRISDDDDKRIKAAIKGLGSDTFKDRQTATAELIRFGIKGYPALLAATKGDDAEVKKRAEDIIETLKGSLPEELFERTTEDVLWTKDGKLVGKISKDSWKVNTTQFGAVEVKLGDIVRLHAIGHPDPEEPKIAVQADPGSLDNLAGQIGKVFAFKVTGAGQGSVWGTGTYTSDSTLAMAAVHAGLLKVGQVGVVKVKIVAPLNSYTGSTKNGITTSGYGPWGGAYEFVK